MGIKICPTVSLLALTTSLFIALPLKANALDIAVYWGQNATNDGTLTETCRSGLYKYVNIAFLYSFGNNRTPQVDLAGHCKPVNGECRKVSNGIINCQGMGIKVMLSIGGGTNTYSLSSVKDAENVALYLWNNFLGGHSDSRPLGPAVLDGIDFDIESGTAHYYAALARKLSELSKQSTKKVYLSAAPQCPYDDPNQKLKRALQTGLFDYVWIQFYNNPQCEFDALDPEKFKRSWRTWTSNIPTSKLFVGLPASRNAAINGFVPSQILKNQVLPFVNGFGNKFGGVMLWDRSNDARTRYSSRIQQG